MIRCPQTARWDGWVKMPDLEDVKIRFRADDLALLRAEAEARKTSLADIVRESVGEHLARAAAARVVPVLDAALAKHVDRLAAMLARTFVAADMAQWQACALYAALAVDRPGGATAAQVQREAQHRAAIDLRARGLEIAGDEDMYTPGKEA